jgi:hypothetical protein
VIFSFLINLVAISGAAAIKHPGKDYHTWDWGGNLIVHEILLRTDGTLSVKVPDTVDQAFAIEKKLNSAPVLGEWEIKIQSASIVNLLTIFLK